MNKQNRQQGVVLISVLVIVALISTSVVLMFKHQNTTTTNIKIIHHQANAVQYLLSLEYFAKGLLQEDSKEKGGLVDHLDENWTKSFSFATDDGQFEVQLFDFQANLNLNTLFSLNEKTQQMQERVSPDFYGCFNRLNASLDSAMTADVLLNYLNDNQLKDFTYPAQLKEIDTLSQENYQKIRPFLRTLESNNTTININTAKDAILRCLHPQLNSEVASNAIKAGRPYKKIDDFYTVLQQQTNLTLEQIKAQFNAFVDIKSAYFTLKGKITSGDLVLNIISVLKRNQRKISIIYRSYYLDNAAY